MPEKKPKILCLDDQRDNLRIRKFFLEQFGCEVIPVEDAQTCLHIATHQPLDLAILDYHLAGDVTGEDVARDLRILVPDLLLMMFSGDPKIPESAKECVDAVYLKGAGSPAELLDVIHSLLPDFDIKPHRKPMSREAVIESLHRNSHR
ncbi:MAG TPA: response regulator [Acidobacteriaceae bacterium]|nr:response regulator [Acidobacteriaceae bacterium]